MPPFLMPITVPSKACSLSLSPYLIFTCTRTVSPTSKDGSSFFMQDSVIFCNASTSISSLIFRYSCHFLQRNIHFECRNLIVLQIVHQHSSSQSPSIRADGRNLLHTVVLYHAAPAIASHFFHSIAQSGIFPGLHNPFCPGYCAFVSLSRRAAVPYCKPSPA